MIFVKAGELLITNTPSQGGNMIDIRDLYHRRHCLRRVSFYKFLLVDVSIRRQAWEPGQEACIVCVLLPQSFEVEVRSKGPPEQRKRPRGCLIHRGTDVRIDVGVLSRNHRRRCLLEVWEWRAG